MTDQTHSIISGRLLIETLRPEHIGALAAILLNEQVYRHIEAAPPSCENFRAGLEHALAGPPPARSGEKWLNYFVRKRADGAPIGWLQASVHDRIAEVAFLFSPACWGLGYASEGLRWLGAMLMAREDCEALWATTVPANLRCQALLLRCGFREATGMKPAHLVTYDEGDLVYSTPEFAAPQESA